MYFKTRAICLSLRRASRVAAAIIATASAPTMSLAQTRHDLPHNASPATPSTTQLVQPKVLCDLSGGRENIPKGATNVEGPFDVIKEPQGSVAALYPLLDTTTDKFYQSLPCDPSIGGYEPPEEADTEDETLTLKDIATWEKAFGEKIANGIKTNSIQPIAVSKIGSGDCTISYRLGKQVTTTSRLPCGGPDFYLAYCNLAGFKTAVSCRLPFDGRDIVFVHGLSKEHLKHLLAGENDGSWPVDREPFEEPAGYFRKYAEDYWSAHIKEHLTDGYQHLAGSGPEYKPKSNRYLVIAWSSAQGLQYAQHAMIKQLADAINTNKNVKGSLPSTSNINLQAPFCFNGCIVISHSTGALLASTAITRAKEGNFGPGVAHIADFVKAHVSFNGAISGSNIGTLAMLVGDLVTSVTGPSDRLCTVLGDAFNMNSQDVCSANAKYFSWTVLRDLVPVIAQKAWGPVLSRSPVPTLTVAGAHTSFYPVKFLLPGFDDGVVSMNSACGNPNRVIPFVRAPSGSFWPLHSWVGQAYQLPISKRSTRNFKSFRNWAGAISPAILLLNQGKNAAGDFFLAGGCSPYISPNGMVMKVTDPLEGTEFAAGARYPNHFSLIQGALDHFHETTPALGDPLPVSPSYSDRDYAASEFSGILEPNKEESSAVTDYGIYQNVDSVTWLLHPAFKQQQWEFLDGRYFKFRLFGVTRKIWVWKRTYHLLSKWQNKSSGHYVYEFVLRR